MATALWLTYIIVISGSWREKGSPNLSEYLGSASPVENITHKSKYLREFLRTSHCHWPALGLEYMRSVSLTCARLAHTTHSPLVPILCVPRDSLKGVAGGSGLKFCHSRGGLLDLALRLLLSLSVRELLSGDSAEWIFPVGTAAVAFAELMLDTKAYHSY